MKHLPPLVLICRQLCVIIAVLLGGGNIILADTYSPTPKRDSASIVVQHLHELPLEIPSIGDAHSYRVLTSQSLDADASTLLNRWHDAYASYTPQYSYKGASTVKDRHHKRKVRLEKLPTTLDLPYNNKVQRSIDLFTQGKKKFIPAMLSLGDYYFPLIETIFDRYGIPLELKYLAVIESGLDPTASSYAGAKGLWQFMVSTGKAYGLEINSIIDERLDIYKSTDAAARHLKDLYNLYGDWLVSLAAYNAGIGNVNKAIRRSGGTCDFWSIYNFLPRQTRDYVPLFIAAYYVMEYYHEYNFERADFVYPSDLDTLYISDRLTVQQIAAKAEIPESLFRLVNPQYRADIIPGDVRQYAVILPMSGIAKLELALASDAVVQNEPEKGSQQPPLSPRIAVSSQQPSVPPSRSYTVRRGDSLYKIAKQHGVSLKALMRANNIASTAHKLIPGDSLEIPTT